MSLTRKDIVGTVGQTVAAYVLAVGVVAAGVAHFTALAGDLKAQQEEVWSVRMDVHTLKADVHTLKADVHTLKVDVHTLKSDVHTLKSDVHQLQLAVTALAEGQKNLVTKDDIAPILQWVSAQQEAAEAEE